MCAGTLLLVSLILLIPWNTGSLWAWPVEEEQQEPLLQALEGHRAAGPLPELLLASEDAEKTGEVGPAEAYSGGAFLYIRASAAHAPVMY